ncbi:MAG TPA: acyl-CoA dehydrogenase [Spirochaetes bacterium]|nr:acyl-CoA dehydrogenase [Spirochaetota bacterium]
MALNPLFDSRDLRFVLFELLEMQKLTENPLYADFDMDMFEDVLNLAEKIAVEQVYPANKEADKIGVKYDPDNKKVIIPEPFKAALDAYNEAGFVAIPESPEVGGMGMPAGIAIACSEIFTSASLSFTTYPGLAHGAAKLIENYGTQELKDVYMGRMYSGQWGGTMCLTEPDAGSDVGALKTKAVKQADGTYLITGQKIFITSGDNDYYENIIHPVLARIEGDPPGTKGISIFLVPKYLAKPDGSLGEFNDVVCSGIEHKMGIHASATCTLSFGDNGKCVGYLLGEERKGMKIMFQMMNEARLGVAMQGLALSTTAYMHAITYARNRQQGVHVTQMLNPEATKVAIVEHPDVKRMLLWMKSYVEGMRMLVYYLAHNINLMHILDGDGKKEAEGLVEILIPICKAGCTDTVLYVTSEAVQVYGGYGYTSDYPVEQYFRDAKITAIYEGTNGIQSMDLTMRKILMNPEQFNYNVWKKSVAGTVAKAKGIVDDKYIALVEKGMVKLDEVINMLKEQMGQGKFLNIFAAATPLQQAMFMMSLAWMHLWSLTLCIPKMKELVGDLKGGEREKFLEDNAEAAFYSGKVLSSQFYLGSEFPKYFGKAEAILFNEPAVIKASKSVFTGAPIE